MPEPLEHPQLIEGTLYVTPAQEQKLRELGESTQPPTAAQRLSAIPVQVVRPNEQVELPSGKILIHSQILDSFYVAEKATFNLPAFNPPVLPLLDPPRQL